MILLIDNYDSFSYNLVQLFGTLWSGEQNKSYPSSGESRRIRGGRAGTDIRVIRNDAMTRRYPERFIRPSSSFLPDPDIQKMPVSVGDRSA